MRIATICGSLAGVLEAMSAPDLLLLQNGKLQRLENLCEKSSPMCEMKLSKPSRYVNHACG